ncbi:MAG: hypothetical protein FJW88_05555 [Actinobacteria bacterium]|nr:hypothetical protein [Actinomycetota bacterium]
MHERILRIGLFLLGLPALVLGVWASAAPRSFYDDFPGAGMAWVAPDGPFNEHLVRDVGALNLALAIVTFAAMFALGVTLVRAVLAAWLVEGTLHLVYHWGHLAPFDDADQIAIVGSLVLVPVLAVALAFVAGLPAQPRGHRALDRAGLPR